ncbi:MAG: 1-(5-phosphoribosyl)-5-[(5-phosphoribosylamino)methylideneamino] imidazole-4-carboxamide isomerase [Bacteroidota bacterium]|nr:1-(5-phosphoribosyl)-5-[(5-phosphoribosylamino)methylideneamino] imidazole-4-carboxamide isomerase [Bacteroidota bacterium]MDP4190844.1 1-(5-phosphoribosyl)-5-[(5-phosphoribosylamino)methylideneamino] imidazole-4-carboxamide isomerase [Bacteroidota bacterium]MDP4193881.1 1-(5-phosphoribosyl)-5-[(5-phosphoribosylamino)methylideneamino] imidazole-4-carboxamide isomerase [Bacteroidota bacterium]
MNKLLVIPSIDIKDGKTVRVVQGIPELDCPDYGNDPVEMALIWRAENAKCIHVVDFNAAWDGSGSPNSSVIEQICSSVIIPVQLGGGIRSLDAAKRAMDMGVYRIVIGSLAVENPTEFRKILDTFGPKHVAAAIDSFENEVVIRGRQVKTRLTPLKFALDLNQWGVERYIVTDVRTNGMMLGPNIGLSKSIAEYTNKKVTLSGGIRNKDDLMDVQKCLDYGVDSVIVGRALYENKFPCQRLWRVAEFGIFS